MNINPVNTIKPLIAVPYRIISKITNTNPQLIVKNFLGFYAYIKDWITYSQAVPPGSTFRPRLDRFLYHYTLLDRYESAGVVNGDYFHQDLWFAKKIFLDNPKQHWDIGSRIDGFITHLLVFRSVNVIDIRKLESKVPGLLFHQGDVTALSLADNSIESISCLHTMEHIGLGRYGDPIDPLGYFKGMQELQRILAPGGKLYFSVPIGQERVEFNAHRIFDPLTIIETFSAFKLIDFAAVNNQGDLVEAAKWEEFRNIDYACGLFIFEKSSPSN